MALQWLMSDNSFQMKQKVRLGVREKYEVSNSQGQHGLTVGTSGFGHVRLDMSVTDVSGNELAFVTTPVVIGSKKTVSLGRYDDKSNAKELGLLCKDRLSMHSKLKVECNGSTLFKVVDESHIDFVGKDAWDLMDPDKKQKWGRIQKAGTFQQGVVGALVAMGTDCDTYTVTFNGGCFSTPEARLLALVSCATMDERYHQQKGDGGLIS
eukprot:Rhum_TRINITY_DN24911_c0_g1::Rhum_TRINITY_DN24911_c0_g1_i1::g.180598::m.180598